MKEEWRHSRNQVFPRKARVKETILPEALQMYEHSNSCDSENQRKQEQTAEGSSSEEEHMENALALGADEGRDKLR